MYGRLHQRKIKQDDFVMSCEKARQELDQYMNDESKRVNVDSAKKRAVLLHMDYEGFRQMVLGANIFPTKSQELYQFSKGNQPNNQPMANKVLLGKVEVKSNNLENLLATGSSEMQCNHFRDFKKRFMKVYDKELDNQKATYLYNLLKEQNEERLSKIFNMECETNILVRISHLFEYVLDYLEKELAQVNEHNTNGKQDQNNAETVRNHLKVQLISEPSFMAKFFQTLLKIPTMTTFSMNILTKGQKKKIADLLVRIKTLVQQEDIEQTNSMIDKFLK